MTDSLQSTLEWAVTQYHHGRPLVLLFDYDGTLADFATSPSQACLPRETEHALQAVADLPRVTAGIISGRELEDLKHMVNLPGLFYAGTSGLECEFEGRTVTHPLVRHCTQMMDQLARSLERRLADYPGAWIEHKRFGLTVHFREVDPKLVGNLDRALEDELGTWGERLHVVTGAKAVEITPNLGWTKGTAVDHLLEWLGRDECIVLYAGDEAADVEALWKVGMHHGIAIGVGQAPSTTAEFKLPDPNAVQHLLEDLGRALGAPPVSEEPQTDSAGL